jgi:glucose-6-phosphate dehydrogenase assembly protein OpcA
VIIDLPDTTVSQVAKNLVKAREEGGVVALGRVLTLVISARNGVAEAAIDAANDASREHPMRVIVLTTGDGESRLDAQIRVGGDAGASEVVVLRAYGEAASNEESLVTGLLLPDAPVVAWWPEEAPAAPSTSPLGRIAQRRITDAATAPDVRQRLDLLGETHAPGDTDLAWTRLTHWREQLAAVLDQPPFDEVTDVEVRGASASPSTAVTGS